MATRTQSYFWLYQNWRFIEANRSFVLIFFKGFRFYVGTPRVWSDIIPELQEALAIDAFYSAILCWLKRSTRGFYNVHRTRDIFSTHFVSIGGIVTKINQSHPIKFMCVVLTENDLKLAAVMECTHKAHSSCLRLCSHCRRCWFQQSMLFAQHHRDSGLFDARKSVIVASLMLHYSFHDLLQG